MAAGARIPASNIRYAVRFRSCTLAHALDSLVRVSRRVRLNCLVEHKRFCQEQARGWFRLQPFSQPSPHFSAERQAQPSGKRHRWQHSRQRLQPAILPQGEIQSTSLPAASRPLNPLSKVLFTLPSWYLFAIGLKHVMLLGHRVPPNWCSIPEEHDSFWANRLQGMTGDRQDPDPRWCSFPRELHLPPSWQSPTAYKSDKLILTLGMSLFIRHYQEIPFRFLFPPPTYMLKFSGFACQAP